MTDPAALAPGHAPGQPHALPPRVLLGTAAALFGLTAATVAISRVDLGTLNVVAALGIAAVKASLVALFFMHLKYQGRFKAVVFVASVLFAVLLIGFVVFDTTQYQPDIRAAAAKARPAQR
ncbi:MAG TPA: cytochrome C oxidase subunit IV family protein [Anaeromyxobacteraceae bacterium]|nr:cytochrome C oxidase subunit IV family protein [Anaeromyxobacteraceae bacterium]